jgi:hypothetical protein
MAEGLVEEIEEFDTGGYGSGGLVHGHYLFTALTAFFGSADIGAGVPACVQQPSGEIIFAHCAGFSAQQNEDGLGGVLGEMPILQLAKAGGIDQAEVLIDEGSKGVVGTTGGVFLKQLRIIHGDNPRRTSKFYSQELSTTLGKWTNFPWGGARRRDRRECGVV